jgi:hypothetical protein
MTKRSITLMGAALIMLVSLAAQSGCRDLCEEASDVLARATETLERADGKLDEAEAKRAKVCATLDGLAEACRKAGAEFAAAQVAVDRLAGYVGRARIVKCALCDDCAAQRSAAMSKEEAARELRELRRALRDE